jgi:hypothetical protein
MSRRKDYRSRHFVGRPENANAPSKPAVEPDELPAPVQLASPGPARPIPRKVEAIQSELAELRTNHPDDYALESVRLVQRLRTLSDRRPRYAKF